VNTSKEGKTWGGYRHGEFARKEVKDRVTHGSESNGKNNQRGGKKDQSTPREKGRLKGKMGKNSPGERDRGQLSLDSERRTSDLNPREVREKGGG